MYVLSIDGENNRIVLGTNNELFSTQLVAKDLNWIMIDKLEKEMKVKAKIRYGAKPTDAVISPLQDNRVKVIFTTAQRAITKGQAVYFMIINMLWVEELSLRLDICIICFAMLNYIIISLFETFK
jgi:tRNA-specific 2-thiouridylase